MRDERADDLRARTLAQQVLPNGVNSVVHLGQRECGILGLHDRLCAFKETACQLKNRLLQGDLPVIDRWGPEFGEERPRIGAFPRRGWILLHLEPSVSKLRRSEQEPCAGQPRIFYDLARGLLGRDPSLDEQCGDCVPDKVGRPPKRWLPEVLN